MTRHTFVIIILMVFEMLITTLYHKHPCTNIVELVNPILLISHGVLTFNDKYFNFMSQNVFRKDEI